MTVRGVFLRRLFAKSVPCPRTLCQAQTRNGCFFLPLPSSPCKRRGAVLDQSKFFSKNWCVGYAARNLVQNSVNISHSLSLSGRAKPQRMCQQFLSTRNWSQLSSFKACISPAYLTPGVFCKVVSGIGNATWNLSMTLRASRSLWSSRHLLSSVNPPDFLAASGPMSATTPRAVRIAALHEAASEPTDKLVLYACVKNYTDLKAKLLAWNTQANCCPPQRVSCAFRTTVELSSLSQFCAKLIRCLDYINWDCTSPCLRKNWPSVPCTKCPIYFLETGSILGGYLKDLYTT